MALDAKSTFTHPIQVNLTAGSDSGVAILIGTGSPAGATDPWASAGKGSLHIRIDATDDYSALYQKVDADSANDDWVPFIAHMDEDNRTLEGHLTMDADKRVYWRGSEISAYSNAASYLTITAPSAVTVADKFRVSSSGTAMAMILAGSGTIAFGALDSLATSTACLEITSLTQNHKVIVSPSTMSGCLSINGVCASPGGELMQMTVTNVASAATDAGNVVFSYLAIQD